MKTRTVGVATAAIALTVTLFGCGGSDDTNSGERPSNADLAAMVQEQSGGAVPVEYSDCVGQKLVDSELPNGVLRSLAAGEEEASVNADNEDKYTDIIDEAQKTCEAELTGN